MLFVRVILSVSLHWRPEGCIPTLALGLSKPISSVYASRHEERTIAFLGVGMGLISGLAAMQQGDIAGNTFTGNTAPSGAAVFRTVSSGDVRDNKQLAATAVDIDNPASN